MALYRVDEAQVVDQATGQLLDGLKGQPVQIVLRDTTTPAPIFEYGSLDPIPSATVTVSDRWTIPRFLVEAGSAADLYLDWLDAASGLRGPVKFEEALRQEGRESKDASQAAQTAAGAAQFAAEAAASAAATLAVGVVRRVNGVAPGPDGNVTVAGGGSGGAVTSVAGKTGDVSLVKADVGLSQVDNTSDANKPVSTLQAAALAGKANAAHTHTVGQVDGLQAALDSKAGVNAPVNASQVNAGTGTINGSKVSGVVKTVNGVAPDGAGNVNVAGGGGGGDVLSVNGQVGAVVLDADDVGALPDTYTPPVTSVAGLTGDVTLNKNSVGLSNVDNTADTAKPVSTLQAAAIAAKAEDSAVVKLSGAQTIAGVKTFSSAPVVPDGSFTQAKVAGLVAALAGKVGSSTITDIVVLTAAAYNALPTPRPSTTFYVKVG